MQDSNAHIQHDELLIMWISFVRAGSCTAAMLTFSIMQDSNAHTQHDELLIMLVLLSGQAHDSDDSQTNRQTQTAI